MSHLSPQPHFDIPPIPGMNLQEKKLNALHQILAGFSAGLPVPVLSLHTRGVATMQELDALLGVLESQGKARREESGNSAPDIWHAVPTTCTDDFCPMGVQ